VGLGLLVGGLDRPAAVIARDQLAGRGGDVGACDRNVEALGAAGLTDQDDRDRAGVEGSVPQARRAPDVLDTGLAVGAGDRDRGEDRGRGELGEAGHAGAFECRSSALARLRWREREDRGVRSHPGRDRDALGQPPPGLAGVRAIHHEFDDPSGEPLQDHVDQRPAQHRLRWPVGVLVVLGPKQPKEDRQADRPTAQALKLDDEHDDDPAVAPPGAPPRALRLSAVMQVVRAPHALARAPEQRVVDGQTDRRAVLDEHRDQEVGQPQPEIVGIPAAPREEVMRATVMPHAGQPRALQHPRHSAVADPGDGPNHEHAERLKGRLREARPEQGQQPGKRSGNLKHGSDPRTGRPRTRSIRPEARVDLIAHPFGVAATSPCSDAQSSPPTPPTPAITAPRPRRSPTVKMPKLERSGGSSISTAARQIGWSTSAPLTLRSRSTRPRT